MAKHITITQLNNALQGMAAKNDARFLKIADAGDLATKDTIEKTDLDSALADEISAATSDIADIESSVSTLIGSDASKSVRTIANEELATQLIPANAQEALDTLQEVSAWIQAHPAEAAAINAKLELGTHEVNNEQVQYDTVKAYVEAYVASQIGGAALQGSNAISVIEGAISLIVDTANANGLEITANGLKLATAGSQVIGYIPASGTYVAGTTYYTDNTGATIVDTTNFEVGSTDVSNYYIQTVTTAATPGAMSAADKIKLDSIEIATDAEITAIINGLYTS